jgi:DNA-binding CsgD family transcriptional regulator
VETFLLPVIDHLRTAVGSRPEQVHIDTLWRTISDILRPVASRLESAVKPSVRLTRRELEVLNLIRFSRTTKEIASALHLSPGTVSAHRRSIRRKLGLSSSGAHLSSYLAAMEAGE